MEENSSQAGAVEVPQHLVLMMGQGVVIQVVKIKWILVCFVSVQSRKRECVLHFFPAHK
jgi:hypothetical protein